MPWSKACRTRSSARDSRSWNRPPPSGEPPSPLHETLMPLRPSSRYSISYPLITALIDENLPRDPSFQAFGHGRAGGMQQRWGEIQQIERVETSALRNARPGGEEDAVASVAAARWPGHVLAPAIAKDLAAEFALLRCHVFTVAPVDDDVRSKLKPRPREQFLRAIGAPHRRRLSGGIAQLVQAFDELIANGLVFVARLY